MSRSVRLVPGVMMAIGLAACATSRSSVPQPSVPTGNTATLTIAANVPVLAQAAMPRGFEPIPFRPPLWLRDRGIAVVGTLRGRTMLVEFGGPGQQGPRVLAADHMPDAPDGTLADIALSPDRASVAIAIARSNGSRIQVVRHDLGSDQTQSLASLDAKFDSASLGWPDAGTIALAIREHPSQAPAKPDQTGPNGDATSSLYLIPANGSGPPERIQLDCALSAMSWSPDGAYAVGQGDTDVPAVLVDRAKRSCLPLGILGAIRVLQWAPKGRAFLYVAPIPGGPVPGIFQFDISTERSAPIAVSSSAAAYVTDTSVLALGNRELTWQLVMTRPQTLAIAEVALIDPTQAAVKIETLGIETLPEMLASSTMAYSPISATAAIELYAPNGVSTLRHIVAYSMAAGKPALLASGPARGIALMSWSPQGNELAIFDGDSKASELTLLAPPPIAATPNAPLAPPTIGILPPSAPPIPPAIH